MPAHALLTSLKSLRRATRQITRCGLALLLSDPLLRTYFRLLDRTTLKTHVLENFRHALGKRRHGTLTDWFNGYRPGPRQLERFRRQRWPAHAPHFTVLVRGQSPWLKETLHSVREQTYSQIDIVCDTLPDDRQETRHNEFICVINAGDVLEPHALQRFAQAIVREPVDVLYGDTVEVDTDGATVLAVHASGGFSYDSFLTRSRPGTLQCVRATLLDEEQRQRVADPSHRAEMDFLLRMIEKRAKVRHLPDVLYCQRATPIESSQTKEIADLIGAHLHRVGMAAEVRTLAGGCRDIRFQIRELWRVAIVIPTKNRRDLLEPCIKSLERSIDPQHADIVVIDHESSDAETQRYLQQLRSRHQVLAHAGPFNFSALMNRAVERLAGPYTHYLLLNNDTEACASGWLEHMMGYAQRSDVGIVGALLLYPNGTVQNAGVNVGAYYRACDAYNGMTARDQHGQIVPGEDGVLLAAREQSGVTGACLLIRADVFSRVGGFDERIAVGYGDIDLCLRVRSLGLKIIFDPHAVFLHHESASRGKSPVDPHPQDTRRFRRKHWPQISQGDFFYSPLRWRIAPAQWNPFARAQIRQ